MNQITAAALITVFAASAALACPPGLQDKSCLAPASLNADPLGSDHVDQANPISPANIKG